MSTSTSVLANTALRSDHSALEPVSPREASPGPLVDTPPAASVSDADVPASGAVNGRLLWQTDFAWKIFNQQQELIRATDQKVYNLIVMSTLLVSLGSANIDRFVVSLGAHQAALGCLVGSAVLFFLVALDTLFARASPGCLPSRESLVFFGHIAARQRRQSYRTDFLASTPEDLVSDVLEQIATVATILDKKLASYRRAWLTAALEVCVFLMIVLFGRWV